MATVYMLFTLPLESSSLEVAERNLVARSRPMLEGHCVMLKLVLQIMRQVAAMLDMYFNLSVLP